MEPVDISVIVCTFNRAASLRNTLESLRGQIVPAWVGWEVVIVDNNSRDDTPKVVEGFAFHAAFPLRYVREERQGLSNARNRGIAESRGRHIAFTDDDVIAPPGWATALLEGFEKGGWDAIGGRVLLHGDWPLPRWLKPELWGFLACLDYGDAEMPLTEIEKPFFGANMAFRREVFERLGGFDPELGRNGAVLIGGEEIDLFHRMLAAGMRVAYQPKAAVRHAVDPKRFRKNYFRSIHYNDGRTTGLRRKDLNGRAFLGIPLFLFPQLARSAGVFVSEGFRQGFENVFRKEMNIWFHLGFMRGRMLRRRAAASPALASEGGR